ncbi:SHOCT domain-containing protein [Acinetobacter sp. YH12049]|uniref:SHOCT domain-containing protein n=1 Tax=Acinetobacter sp. YH12049 TaxID=2601054 RepID=UPI0015D16368|nr:SHOCT domain-containing protein [Acinetobacter sp. YH12049]
MWLDDLIGILLILLDKSPTFFVGLLFEITMNKPLESLEILKIITFMLFQLCVAMLIVGLIPGILILIAYWLMRREKDINVLNRFSNLINSYVNLVYLGILIWGGCIFFLEFRGGSENIDISWLFLVGFLVVLFLVTTYFYEFLIEKFFFSVLLSHSEWVEQNGIFSYKKDHESLSVFKMEKLKSYSVADELLKWKKLRDEGLVTEEEYEIMKRKILEN